MPGRGAPTFNQRRGLPGFKASKQQGLLIRVSIGLIPIYFLDRRATYIQSEPVSSSNTTTYGLGSGTTHNQNQLRPTTIAFYYKPYPIAMGGDK